MRFKKLLLFLAILPLFAFTAHKYYLSNTQINFNDKNQSLEIIINVFMDDIELAVNTDYSINLQLTTEKELQNSDEYFEKYLKEKLPMEREKQSLNQR